MSSILTTTTNCYKNCSKSQVLSNIFTRKKRNLKNYPARFTHDHKQSSEENAPASQKYVPFIDVIKQRKAEAERSILVQVQSAKSVSELHSHCSSFGNIRHMFHYTIGLDNMHFILVEFADETGVSNILSDSSHLNDIQVVPVHSPFLWFRTQSKRNAKVKTKVETPNLEIENGTAALDDTQIANELQKCNSISDQMMTLYNITKLNDLGTRLRFLTAQQIERSISGMFPHAQAFPFGSSVNGYGKMGCDLDLVLRLNDETRNEDSRLVFHAKASPGSERSLAQRNMKTIGDLIQLFLPGCGQVRSILQARVPIIKYYQQFAGVDCDLSMTNMSGFHMSDLLYLMGSADPQVRPLVYTIRRWASAAGLTNSSPGRWISNFSLTLLALAFLQRRRDDRDRAPLLPSLNTLIKLARPGDRHVTEDGINCTFLRDLSHLPRPRGRAAGEEADLEALLKEFFEFYSQFDFATKAVCLNEAVSITKPDHSALYIVNPLERGLNVSKNVSLDELEKFKYEARNALWSLESDEGRDRESRSWGILGLLEGSKSAPGLNFVIASSKQTRLVEVSRLFDDDESEKEPVVGDKSADGEPKTEYKNEQTKKDVENVKRDTQNMLNEIYKVQNSNR